MFHDSLFKMSFTKKESIYIFVISILSTKPLIQSQIGLGFHCFYLEITWKIHGILCRQNMRIQFIDINEGPALFQAFTYTYQYNSIIIMCPDSSTADPQTRSWWWRSCRTSTDTSTRLGACNTSITSIPAVNRAPWENLQATHAARGSLAICRAWNICLHKKNTVKRTV